MEQLQELGTKEHYLYIAGVDEAGRGPLAGPVVAAAVILNPNCEIKDLKDSKKLSPTKRERVYAEIIQTAFDYGIGRAEVCEIDELNIFQATMLAMKRAILQLSLIPKEVLIDGTHAPKIKFPTRTIIRGDETELAISAASILAKVTRDREMVNSELDYPGYGFAKHKGYHTKEHFNALTKLGPCIIHRRSFAPVKNLL